MRRRANRTPRICLARCSRCLRNSGILPGDSELMLPSRSQAIFHVAGGTKRGQFFHRRMLKADQAHAVSRAGRTYLQPSSFRQPSSVSTSCSDQACVRLHKAVAGLSPPGQAPAGSTTGGSKIRIAKAGRSARYVTGFARRRGIQAGRGWRRGRRGDTSRLHRCGERGRR